MSRRSEHTTKVFVGSLPPNVTADDLRQLFAPYGAIAECDIANRCGFLHLEDKDLAEKAIRELNDTTFMGGRISVERGRVKSRTDRRMRGGGRGGGGGGGMMGRKREMGPYSRDGFNRGGGAVGGMAPRNNFRDNYRSYDEYRDYSGRYDDRYDRRPPMYDDRRGGNGPNSNGGGYMNDRNNYSNGYDRRPYSDDRTPYDMTNRPYDDGRMPSVATAMAPADDQSMNQNPMRAQGYDSRPPQSGGDIYSRRDGPKPLTGTYDRTAQATGYSTYGSMNTNMGYPAAQQTTNYATTGALNNTYSTTPMQNATYGGDRSANTYVDTGRQPVGGGMVNQGYSTNQMPSTGYNTMPQTGSAGGFGDNYGIRSGQQTNYDTSYPPLPQQRGFAGGNAPGPHRDMPPTRRYFEAT